MLHILYGADNYSLHQALDKIKRSASDEAAAGANTTVLEGNQVSLNELKNICETVPFLAEKRLVIINGLLERFEPKVKSGQAKKTTRTNDQPKEWQLLAGCMNKIPDSTILVLVDGKISNKNPLLKEIVPHAEVRTFPLLKRNELPSWLQKRVAQAGGKISPQAVDLMAKLVGSDLWAMANEVDKLVLFTLGRFIEEKDVRTIVSHAQEANVFAMVDAILERKDNFAVELLQQLLERGAAPTYLLWMLHRQVQFIVLAKELSAQKKTKAEIQARLGLSDYPFQKTLEQAERYSLERWKRVYEKLLETDLAIKTGKYDGELALNILVIELCQR